MINAAFPDPAGIHSTEPIPPKPHRFIAKIDAAFEQDVLDLP
jgi:hypothetical protein